MSDTNPQGPGVNRPDPSDVARELHEMGRNLANILRGAWGSDERRRLNDEIRQGVSDLTDTVNQAVSQFRQSSTGQRVEGEIHDFHERIRAGEVDTKIREEILSALRTVNTELEKCTKRTETPPPADEPPAV